MRQLSWDMFRALAQTLDTPHHLTRDLHYCPQSNAPVLNILFRDNNKTCRDISYGPLPIGQLPLAALWKIANSLSRWMFRTLLQVKRVRA